MTKLFAFSLSLLMALTEIADAAERGTNPEAYSGPAWSPYVVGALIGVLSMLTFYFSNKPLGASTAYARVAGMLGSLVAPRHTKSLRYYQENKPVIDWEVMLVLGAVLGAFLSAWQGMRMYPPCLWSSPGLHRSEPPSGSGMTVSKDVSSMRLLLNV
jgi:uncharacterized membrane protein YfcA